MRLFIVLFAGFLGSRNQFRVGCIRTDSTACLRQKRQRALFRVELQQREAVYEMKRRVEVASDGRTKGPRGCGASWGAMWRVYAGEEGVQSRGRRAIIRASGSRRLRLTFHSAPA